MDTYSKPATFGDNIHYFCKTPCKDPSKDKLSDYYIVAGNNSLIFYDVKVGVCADSGQDSDFELLGTIVYTYPIITFSGLNLLIEDGRCCRYPSWTYSVCRVSL